MSPLIELDDGHQLPALGLGLFQATDEASIRRAVEIGYQLFDTAPIYENEGLLGRTLAAAAERTQYFVTTKLNHKDHGYDAALKAFEVSLKALGLDYLDCHMIHWPRPAMNLYVDSWKALVRLKQEGRIRTIGVSNVAEDHIERIVAETGLTPAVNQVELHPAFQQDHLGQIGWPLRSPDGRCR